MSILGEVEIKNRRLWQRPSLKSDEEKGGGQRVTWLELFYDLVFVVVIAELSHTLSEGINLVSLGTFSFLFVPIWWVWIGVTFYNERFKSNEVSYRLFLFLQMIPVAAMAVFADDALGEGSTGFALAYVSARVMYIILVLRGGWYEKTFRPVSIRSAIGSGISVSLFLASVFVPPPLKFALWAIGLLVELLNPWLALKHIATLPRVSSSWLPERFGLFTIIVLGEAIVGVISGVARNQEATDVGLTAVVGLALVFGIWWVYFDFVASRPPKPGVWPTIFWVYLHMPMVIAIAATGAALLAVVGSQGGPLHADVRWLISCAVAVSLVTIGLIELLLQREPDYPPHSLISPSLKFMGGTTAAGVGFLGGFLAQLPLLSILTMPVLVQIVYGAYVEPGPLSTDTQTLDQQ